MHQFNALFSSSRRRRHYHRVGFLTRIVTPSYAISSSHYSYYVGWENTLMTYWVIAIHFITCIHFSFSVHCARHVGSF